MRIAVAVAVAREQFGKPEKKKTPPLCPVTRALVNTTAIVKTMYVPQ
jgi:hypothetical protein